MSNDDKKIIITPNTNNSSLPKINFNGKGNQSIKMEIQDEGDLFFNGDNGSLLEIKAETSSLFSVNDISGINILKCNPNHITDIKEIDSESIRDISDSELVLSMNMENISDTVIWDSSKKNNNGTLVNGPTAVSSGGFNNGGYLLFGGVDDFIQITSNSTLNLSGKKTINVWIYITAVPSGVQGIVCKSNYSSTGGGWGLFLTNTFLGYYAFNGVGSSPLYYTAISSVPLNQWNMITITKNTDTAVTTGSIKLYINSVLIQGTESNFGSTYASDNVRPVTIGSFSSGTTPFYSYPFSGRIDDVMLYNRVLSDSEIKRIFYKKIEAKQSISGIPSLTVNGTVRCTSRLTDTTPGWSKTEDEALNSIINIKNKQINEAILIDHESLPEESIIIIDDESKRDLGMMITLLCESVKSLNCKIDCLEERIKKLKGGINA